MKFAFAASIAAATALGESTYVDPIAPTDFYQAVSYFDMETPTTDQAIYEKQLDIYSDQIIAVEALRLQVLQVQMSIDSIEAALASNRQLINQTNL